MTHRGFTLALITLFLGCGDSGRSGSDTDTDTDAGADASMVGSDAAMEDSGSDLDAGTDPEACPTGEHRPYDGAACEPVSCGAVSSPENGSVEVETTTYESVVTYSCDPGYMLSGEATRTCTADGTWSGEQPTCELTDCGAPPAPANGSVSIDGTGAGARATYACDEGYWLVRGQHSVCTDAGWLGETPSCEPVLACVCDGFLYVGEAVVSTGTTPPEGTEGTVYSGLEAGLVGVAWDSWAAGHDGNCDTVTTACGTCVDGGSNKRYVSCFNITTRRLYCACDAVYTVGDRVVLLEDVDAIGGSTIPQGTEGTVIAASDGGPTFMLVEWDGWTEGHDGNCGTADCGDCTPSGTSRYYVGCDVIGRAP